MLLHIPNVFSADDLTHTRTLLANAPWADGRETAGDQAVRMKNNQQLSRDSQAAKEIQGKVLGALDKSALFFSAALPKKVFTPHVNRYGDGSNFYGPHVDNAVRFAPHTGLKIRTDLSATLFLNEPGEYEGGELCIGRGAEARDIKLPAGHLVLYPGSSVHEVRPVTRGFRLASFFWIESMVRSDAQRRLLFDLDMAILSLRQHHGESDEVLQLTGSYHNLLRMWADT